MPQDRYLTDDRPEFDARITEYIRENPDYFDGRDWLAIRYNGKLYREIQFELDHQITIDGFFVGELGFVDEYQENYMLLLKGRPSKHLTIYRQR